MKNLSHTEFIIFIDFENPLNCGLGPADLCVNKLPKLVFT